jgi:hypothetical protein
VRQAPGRRARPAPILIQPFKLPQPHEREQPWTFLPTVFLACQAYRRCISACRAAVLLSSPAQCMVAVGSIPGLARASGFRCNRGEALDPMT